jgi:hypothetical protein
MKTKDNLLNTFIEVDESSIADGNKIQGKMQINGINYNAICDCDQITPTNSKEINNIDYHTSGATVPTKRRLIIRSLYYFRTLWHKFSKS